MKVIISGGGTGGHIYPALTIAKAIQESDPTAQILFVGTKAGLESMIIPKAGYPIEYIEVEGFSRKIGLTLLKNITVALKSCMQARKIIKSFRPDLVIGTGGYVCGPVVLTAHLLGIKTCIQEQNAQAGITNKILSKFVDKIFLGYAQAAAQLGSTNKTSFTGNPVRSSMFAVDKQQAYTHFGLDSAKKTLLVYGGSRGARSINQAMLDFYKKADTFQTLQIIHITGETDYQNVLEATAGLNLDKNSIKIYPYMHEMDQLLNITDLAVSRAGAIAIAEFLALGIAAVLIPYPYATANHQEFNAQAVVDGRAGLMILDKDLSGEQLIEVLRSVLTDETQLAQLAANAKKMGNKNAAADIAAAALSLVRR